MAMCDWCGNDMVDPSLLSCQNNEEIEFPDGLKLPAVPYEPSYQIARCHDCNVSRGGKHHPGCDAERCPRCWGQLISCGCLDDEEWEE